MFFYFLKITVIENERNSVKNERKMSIEKGIKYKESIWGVQRVRMIFQTRSNDLVKEGLVISS